MFKKKYREKLKNTYQKSNFLLESTKEANDVVYTVLVAKINSDRIDQLKKFDLISYQLDKLQEVQN